MQTHLYCISVINFYQSFTLETSNERWPVFYIVYLSETRWLEIEKMVDK